MLLIFVVAPTPGDIGGCGQEAQLLDAKAFFYNKRLVDCRRCQDCGLESYYPYCKAACEDPESVPEEFPSGCMPLVHDGEVCLRALEHSSCKTYASYVKDDPRTRSMPSECNFCPL